MSEYECIHGLSDPAWCGHCRGESKMLGEKSAGHNKRTPGTSPMIKLESFLANATCLGCDPISNDRDNTADWHRGSMKAAQEWNYWLNPVNM